MSLYVPALMPPRNVTSLYVFPGLHFPGDPGPLAVASPLPGEATPDLVVAETGPLAAGLFVELTGPKAGFAAASP